MWCSNLTWVIWKNRLRLNHWATSQSLIFLMLMSTAWCSLPSLHLIFVFSKHSWPHVFCAPTMQPSTPFKKCFLFQTCKDTIRFCRGVSKESYVSDFLLSWFSPSHALLVTFQPPCGLFPLLCPMCHIAPPPFLSSSCSSVFISQPMWMLATTSMCTYKCYKLACAYETVPALVTSVLIPSDLMTQSWKLLLFAIPV